MKIAEALALRADLQRRLEQLKQRLVKNARIQEGDAPEEDPAELQSELEKSARELTLLIQRINRTNAASRFGAGTIADALAERDVLKIRYNVYRELANAASTAQGRTTRSEVTANALLRHSMLLSRNCEGQHSGSPGAGAPSMSTTIPFRISTWPTSFRK